MAALEQQSSATALPIFVKTLNLSLSTMNYSLLCAASRNNVIVIGGDMNAQIGKNENHKYSLHNSPKRNGQHLTDFTRKKINMPKYKLSKKKREGKLWTNTYVNNAKGQIDFVFINKQWKNSAVNCGAYSSFVGVSSDHRIVTAKMQLSLRKNATRATTTISYEWALFHSKDIRDKYMIVLRNKFDALQEKTETRTPNDEYVNFVNPHLEAAAKYIPTKHRTKSKSNGRH